MAAAAHIQLAQLTNKGNDNAKIGIARWLAPETTAIDPEFTEKSDVFALGVVLWEISEGSIPFPEVAGDADILKLVKHERKRPQFSRECPKVLANVITCCWDHDAAKRPRIAEILKVVESEAPKERIPAQVYRRMPLLIRYFYLNFFFFLKRIMSYATMSW
jgi:serine/threonine protein kinase